MESSSNTDVCHALAQVLINNNMKELEETLELQMKRLYLLKKDCNWLYLVEVLNALKNDESDEDEEIIFIPRTVWVERYFDSDYIKGSGVIHSGGNGF